MGRGGRGCIHPDQTLPSALLGPQSPEQKAAIMWAWEGPSIGGVLVGQSREVLWLEFHNLCDSTAFPNVSLIMRHLCFSSQYVLFPCSIMQFCLFTFPFKQNSTSLNYFLYFFSTASSAVWSNPKVYSHPKPLSVMNGEPHCILGIYTLSWNYIYMRSFMGMALW